MQLEDRSLPAGIQLIRWPGGDSPFSFRKVPRKTAELRKLISEINPDLMHSGPRTQTAAGFGGKSPSSR